MRQVRVLIFLSFFSPRFSPPAFFPALGTASGTDLAARATDTAARATDLAAHRSVPSGREKGRISSLAEKKKDKSREKRKNLTLLDPPPTPKKNKKTKHPGPGRRRAPPLVRRPRQVPRLRPGEARPRGRRPRPPHLAAARVDRHRREERRRLQKGPAHHAAGPVRPRPDRGPLPRGGEAGLRGAAGAARRGRGRRRVEETVGVGRREEEEEERRRRKRRERRGSPRLFSSFSRLVLTLFFCFPFPFSVPFLYLCELLPPFSFEEKKKRRKKIRWRAAGSGSAGLRKNGRKRKREGREREGRERERSEKHGLSPPRLSRSEKSKCRADPPRVAA